MKQLIKFILSLILVCSVAGVYCLLAFTGNFFKIDDAAFTSFWLPSGFFLGMLLVTPKKQWIYIVAGAIAGNLIFDFFDGKELHISLFFIAANLTTGLTGALLYRRLLFDEVTLFQVRNVMIFIVVAGFAATIPGALIGSFVLYYFFHPESWILVFFKWWSGDFFGILVIAPVVLCIKDFFVSGVIFSRKEVLKALLFYTSFLFFFALVFFILKERWIAFEFLIVYCIVISLNWSSVRVVPFNNVLISVFVLCAFLYYSRDILHMLGWSPDFLVTNVQLFVDAMCIIALVISASFHEIRFTKKKLGELYHVERKFAEISARFINSPVDDAYTVVSRALHELIPVMNCDVIALSEIDPKHKRLLSRFCFDKSGPISMSRFVPGSFPVLVDMMLQGKLFEYYSMENIPVVAVNEKYFITTTGIKSAVSVPLSLRGEVVWVIGLLKFNDSTRFDIDIIARLKTIGELFVNMLDKMKIDEQRNSFQNRANAILDALPDLMLIMNGRGEIKDYHVSNHEKLLMPPEKFLNVSFNEYLTPEVSSLYLEKIHSVLKNNSFESIEFPFIFPDQIRYYESRIVKLNQKEVLAMLHDITSSKEYLRMISESEERFRQLTDNVNEAFWLRDKATRKMIYISPGYERIWGRSRASLYENSSSFFEWVHPDDQERVNDSQRKMYDENMPFNEKYRIIRPGGEVRWISVKTFPVYDDRGIVYRYAGIGEDITESLETQEYIKKSLQEKEILLKEIHHRVKNNLQVISSLINLGQSKYSPERFNDFVMQTRLRINSMALLHEKLYQASDVSYINMREYIEKLVGELVIIYSGYENKIDVVFDVDSIFISIETALPCSLILNEAVTNSLKYAFKNGATPQLTVAFKRVDAKLVLSIRDNGVGMETRPDMTNIKTLGFELIHVLAMQLKGTLELTNDNGFAVVVRFPDPQR